MTSSDLIELIKAVSPYLVAILTFFLGRSSSIRSDRKKLLEERVYTFYVPYFKFVGQYLRYAASQDDYLDRMNGYINFLWDNYRYANTKSQTVILKFLDEALAQNYDSWNQMIQQINTLVEEEYCQICKQLKYPLPRLPVYAQFPHYIPNAEEEQMTEVKITHEPGSI